MRLHRCWLLSTLLLATLWPGAAAAPFAQAATPANESAERELIVRFARAYGMALGTAPDDEDPDALREPEHLDAERRAQLQEILNEGGLTLDEWRGMFARMDADAELEARINSLSTPFRIQ